MVNEILAGQEERDHGKVPDAKDDGVVRLCGEDVNSIGLHNKEQAWKIKRLQDINKKYQKDATLLIEGSTGWRQAPEGKEFKKFLGGHNDKVAVTGSNTTD